MENIPNTRYTTLKLTGLRNRRYFHLKLEELIIDFEKGQVPFSLCIFDIDYFKKINDTYGHQVGDKVLVQLAGLVKDIIREEDSVLCYGGEEFIILYPRASEAIAHKEAEKIRRAIEESKWDVGSVTISMGISTYGKNDTHSSIVERADKALYYSKANGRNRVTHIDQIGEDTDAF